MSSTERTKLENALTKIRIPQSQISLIIKNFEMVANDIIGGRLARLKEGSQKLAPLEQISQKIIADPAFRNQFITDYKAAVKTLGYYTPDQK